jgi:hypothetical protein
MDTIHDPLFYKHLLQHFIVKANVYVFKFWLGAQLVFFGDLAYRPQLPSLSPNDSPVQTLQPSDISTYERSNPVIFRNDSLLPRKSQGSTNNRSVIVGAGRDIDIAVLLHAPLGPGQERTFLCRSVRRRLKKLGWPVTRIIWTSRHRNVNRLLHVAYLRSFERKEFKEIWERTTKSSFHRTQFTQLNNWKEKD